MNCDVLRFEAKFFRLLGTGEEVEAGAAGPSGPYPRRVQAMIGQRVAELHASGLIRKTNRAVPASRKSRNGTATQTWIATDPAECLERADVLERALSTLEERSEQDSTFRQLVLF